MRGPATPRATAMREGQSSPALPKSQKDCEPLPGMALVAQSSFPSEESQEPTTSFEMENQYVAPNPLEPTPGSKCSRLQLHPSSIPGRNCHEERPGRMSARR